MLIGRPDLGFLPIGAAILVFVFPLAVLISRRRWRMAVARAEEVRRLAWLAAEESARAEIEAASLAYAPIESEPAAPKARPAPVMLPPECAVCSRHTTKLCARCKGVRYCSGKCQIVHWRQGHKDECHPPRIDGHDSGLESLSKLSGLDINQSSPNDSSSELNGKFHAKSVEPLSERPPSESKVSDVSQENTRNETKPYLDTSETESTSDFLVDSSSSSSSSSSSLSSSSTSSLPPPTPPPSKSYTPSPPESSDEASAREDLGILHSVEMGKASCDNSFSGGCRARSNMTETKLTGVPLCQSDGTNTVNNLSGTSNIDQTMCTSEPKKDDWTRMNGPVGTPFIGSDIGTNSGPSKDALECEVGDIHLNSESSQLESKLPPTGKSYTDTYLHRRTLSGDTTQSNFKNLESVGVYKPNPVISGRCNDGCLGKLKTLKPQSSFSSMHHESSSGGRCSISHDASLKIDIAPILSSKSSESIGSVPNGISDFKTSVKRVVQQFKSSQLPKSHFSVSRSDVSRKYKVLFPYDLFVKLYNYEKVDLYPCGLTNCGNSCYANAVLQCLAFTRPLTSYLLQGFHSKTCASREWCFTCELGSLLAKSKQGQSPVSPIGILSHIQTIGSNLGHGKQEDAHEFLRYAIDTMQTVCLKEAGADAVGISAEETTLIQLIFGGYLRSRIKCTRCRSKSERRERMMDLTVEIHGDIGTLEEALTRFTATEILDGENKYQCSRCNSYERARKKLSVLEAPNVLTIALKRFQSGKFGKLNKAVRFPELLNLAPYMSGTDDKSPVYSLYAVVVHQDIMNAAFSGHYVCYVKTTQGKWYKTDDSKVKVVDIESVLAKNAYMLLYARCSPRAPISIRGGMSHDNLRTKKSKQKESLSQARPPYRPYHPSYIERLPFPKADSSSDVSSLLSSSDGGSCTTESTRDSTTSAEDFSDYIFGDSGRFSWSQSSGLSDTDGSGYSPLFPAQSEYSSSGFEREDLSSRRLLYSDTTNQSRKLSRDREVKLNALAKRVKSFDGQ